MRTILLTHGRPISVNYHSNTEYEMFRIFLNDGYRFLIDRNRKDHFYFNLYNSAITVLKVFSLYINLDKINRADTT